MTGQHTAPSPTEIKLKKHTRQLEVVFSDGKRFGLTAEYLRVFSPSAEVTGHGLQERLLVAEKASVSIERIEPVGRYAVKLVFDDGHDTGLYTWPILYELGTNYESNWLRYLERLDEAGLRRSAVEEDGGQPRRNP